MRSTLTAKNVVHQGNSLTLELTFDSMYIERRFQSPFARDRNYDPTISTLSSKYLINCLVEFQAKVVRTENNALYFVRFVLKRYIDQLTYTVKYSHRAYNSYISSLVEEQECSIINEQWQLMSEFKYNSYYTFHISVNLSISTWVNPFERIQNDTKLTDFELRGEDGSVSFHNAVAACFSPVLKAGAYGECGRRGVIDTPPGTTKQTLQHLKDYMYSGKMPVDGLKELLLLASYFIMPDLELRCVLDLLTDVTSEDAYDLFQFGRKHGLSKLIFEIWHRGQKGIISVNTTQKPWEWNRNSFRRVHFSFGV